MNLSLFSRRIPDKPAAGALKHGNDVLAGPTNMSHNLDRPTAGNIFSAYVKVYEKAQMKIMTLGWNHAETDNKIGKRPYII